MWTEGPGPALPPATFRVPSGLGHQHKSQEAGSWPTASVIPPNKAFRTLITNTGFKIPLTLFSLAWGRKMFHTCKVSKDGGVWNRSSRFRNQCIKIYFFQIPFSTLEMQPKVDLVLNKHIFLFFFCNSYMVKTLTGHALRKYLGSEAAAQTTLNTHSEGCNEWNSVGKHADRHEPEHTECRLHWPQRTRPVFSPPSFCLFKMFVTLTHTQIQMLPSGCHMDKGMIFIVFKIYISGFKLSSLNSPVVRPLAITQNCTIVRRGANKKYSLGIIFWK